MSKLTRTTATVAATLLVVVGAGAAAWAATPGVGDVSDAMRYDASAPIGTIVGDLTGTDDDSTTVAAPFALNFFGVVSNGVCISTNGGFYPVPTAGDGCSDAYDMDLENLALDSSASMIAAMATDLDLGECDDNTPDGFGTPCEIYFGTTTVDGRDAFVITWYRVPMNSDDNDRALSNTFQIVIIKKATGDDTVGWDFDIEFNFGTIKDLEDGYSAADGSSECDSDTAIADCRYGVGWASYDGAGPTATPYELFGSTPITDLGDGGAYPLVKNGLNSSVLGRYTFGMVGGVTTGFSAPVLVAANGGELAATGSDESGLVWIAVGLVVAGAALVAVRVRRSVR